MAYILMALYSYGLYSYGLYGYGLNGYGLHSYGLYSGGEIKVYQAGGDGDDANLRWRSPCQWNGQMRYSH